MSATGLLTDQYELTMLDARKSDNPFDHDGEAGEGAGAAAGSQSPPARSVDELEDEIPF